jgi:hypothetical protein
MCHGESQEEGQEESQEGVVLPESASSGALVHRYSRSLYFVPEFGSIASR